MAAEMVARDQPNSRSKGTMSTPAVARMAAATSSTTKVAPATRQAGWMRRIGPSMPDVRQGCFRLRGNNQQLRRRIPAPSARERLMKQIADEIAVDGQRLSGGEASVELMPVFDALLTVLPAEIHRPAVQLAAEVDQPLGAFHLDAELGHLAQQIAEFGDDAGRSRLQPLHRLRRGRIDLDLRPVDGPARGRQLFLRSHQLIAQLARPGELLLERVDQTVGLAQRENARGKRDVHGAHPTASERRGGPPP